MFTYSIQELLLGILYYGTIILIGSIIGTIVFNWFGGYPSNGLLQAAHDAVHALADPILGPIRGRIPPLQLGGLGLDLSPIIAILVIWMGGRILTFIIRDFIGPITG